MWHRVSLFCVVILSILALPQSVKHAPTLQSCEADINLWTSEISGFPRVHLDALRSGTKSITVLEMNGRERSMVECVTAYPQLMEEPSGAMRLMQLYDQEIQLRYLKFIQRHGLADKFDEEDRVGKR